MTRLPMTYVACLTLAGIIAIASRASAQERATAAHVLPNVVSCKLIRTPAQLQGMQNDLASTYCLANDIDLASIPNFIPIGEGAMPFTGSFFGNNHVIRNLTVNDSSRDSVGLFGLFRGKAIRDVSLINVRINATASSASAGGLVGEASDFDPGPTITNVSVTGKVVCNANNGSCGGVVGQLTNYALNNSWSSADVTGLQVAGGLVGVNSGTISDSFAVGEVTCTGTGLCRGGGLVGFSDRNRRIDRSFATGAVTGADFSAVGGLVGDGEGIISQSFATSPVTAGTSAVAGGLVGQAPAASIDQSFAAGRVSSGPGAIAGGLIGTVLGGATVTNSYWDTDTTNMPASSGGSGLTTLQLRAGVPPGFDPALWDSNAGLSYPFLNNGGADFTPPLATQVLANQVFTFLPISQLDASQYRVKPLHAANAALATAYTMLARAIGAAEGVAELKDVKIDRHFWRDSTGTTSFAGPVAQRAIIGNVVTIGAAANLNSVVNILKAQRLVILRGTFTGANGGTRTHWMLATLFTKDANGNAAAIVANDPWTGRQVEIDPRSKKVVWPSDFPLANFKIDGFQTAIIRNPV